MGARRLLDVTALALVVATLLALSVHKIVSLDVWWQLATGELVLESGWPRIDPFSYGEPGRPWIEMRWLYCVAAYWIFEHLGLNYLILAKTLILLGVAALLLRTRRGGPLWSAAAGIALFALMAHPRFLVRPEIVTFLFLAVLLERLDDGEGKLSRRSLCAVLVLQVIWANTHSTFLVGPAVLWIFAVAQGGRLLLDGSSPREAVAGVGSLLTAAGGATAICLVNPYGIDGFLFPLRLLGQIQGDHPLNQIIQEFLSPLRLGPASTAFRVLVLGAAPAALSFLLRRRRSQLPWLTLWLAFLALALMAQRNVALLGVVSAFVVVRNLRLAASAPRWMAGTVNTAVLTFSLVLLPAVVSDAYPIRFGRAERFGFGLSSYTTPFAALDFVRREGLPRPVIGKLGEGGAFLFDGGPRSTFIDGRLEIYSAEFIRLYRRVLGSRAAWDEVTTTLGVRTAVLKHTQTEVTVAMLDDHPSWTPVYLDPRFVVFLRIDDQTRDIARARAFDWAASEPTTPSTPDELRAADWFAGWPPRFRDPVPARDLGRFFLARGQLERSRDYFLQAHESAPGRRQIRVILALLARALGDEEEAAALLSGSAARLAREPAMLSLQGRLFELRDRPLDALDAYEAALVAGGLDFGPVVRLAKRLEQPRRALHALQRRAETAAVTSELLNALGVLYLESGDSARATDTFEASLHLQPTQPEVLNQLGILAARAALPREARRYFERALEVDPRNAAARANLRRLDSLQ